MAYSILIKNGKIVDGTGRKAYVGNVAIDGGKIKAVGEASGAADKIIDATGFYVMPGFIDLTSHSDTYGTIFASPLQESLLLQGYTTILLGNCGESLAPVASKEFLKDLERWIKIPSININWNSVAEYYNTLETLNLGLNTATLIGHETLKRGAKDLQEMQFLLSQALSEGAWGLSSNFSFTEWGAAAEEETLALLSIVKKFDGLYKIHLGDEGKNLLPSIASVLDLARKSGVRTVISHFKAIGRGTWPDFKKGVQMIERAKNEGINIAYDAFPYLRTGSMLLEFLPLWAREGDKEKILSRFADTDLVGKILLELKAATLHPERILLASAENDKKIVGLTLGEAAERIGVSHEEAILQILKSNNLNVTVFGRTISAKNMLNFFKEPEAMMATDGAGYNLEFKKLGDLVHPRSFASAERFLNLISKKSGISLEDAVKKMTSLPAKYLNMKSKGELLPGYDADLVVLDLEKFRSRGTYKDSYAYAEGVNHVIVGGRAAVEGGEVKSPGIGKALRKA